MPLALILAFCVALAIIAIFVGTLNLAHDEEMEARLAAYAARSLTAPEHEEGTKRSGLVEGLNRLISRQSFADQIATMLARANAPLKVPEFVLITIGCATLGGMLGILVSRQVISGIGLGVAGFFAPRLYLRLRRNRRHHSFEDQLPDVLTMLVGGLRAGYSLLHSMDVVVQEMPSPASEEFRRVVQEVGLGLALEQSLENLVRRMQSPDLDLIVTAINVQHEVGGNLATILETISSTIRERMRIHREIRSITAQQRLTGYVLALLPFGLGGVLLIINPTYMMRLFEPGSLLCIPIAAVIMVMIGFMVIRKIVSIEV
jgi:tight adherence protein B